MKQGKKVKRLIWGGYWFLSKNPEVKEELNAGYVREFQTHDMIFAVLRIMVGRTRSSVPS
ncbi:hypothetical protein ABNG30_29485 [Bacillus thuringiensis]